MEVGPQNILSIIALRKDGAKVHSSMGGEREVKRESKKEREKEERRRGREREQRFVS